MEEIERLKINQDSLKEQITRLSDKLQKQDAQLTEKNKAIDILIKKREEDREEFLSRIDSQQERYDSEISNLKNELILANRMWLDRGRELEKAKDENARLKGLIDKAWDAGALEEYGSHFGRVPNPAPDLETWKKQNNLV